MQYNTLSIQYYVCNIIHIQYIDWVMNKSITFCDLFCTSIFDDQCTILSEWHVFRTERSCEQSSTVQPRNFHCLKLQNQRLEKGLKCVNLLMTLPCSHTEFLIHGYSREKFETFNNKLVPLDIKSICGHYVGYKLCCIASKLMNNPSIAFQFMEYHDYYPKFTDQTIQHWITNTLDFPKERAKKYTEIFINHGTTTLKQVITKFHCDSTQQLQQYWYSMDHTEFMLTNIEKIPPTTNTFINKHLLMIIIMNGIQTLNYHLSYLKIKKLLKI